MKQYPVKLDRKQYAMLERMLSADNARRLAEQRPIPGMELFADLLEEIYSPVSDGWSTLEVLMQESAEELALLRTLTAYVYPEDTDFFVRQLGQEPECSKQFALRIDL